MRRTLCLVIWGGALAPGLGCNSIINGWLDPSIVGQFAENRTSEIRTTLTLEDSPFGVPGSELPTLKDLELRICEYSITAGDTLAIEINELRQRQIPYVTETQVATGGYVNLPVVGRVKAVGLTVPQFEEALVARLKERSVLLEPQVVVNALFLQEATYSIFGIGVSASTNAPLRAGVFPIRRPDLRILEAINQVGGLNEFVTDVFVFRTEEPCSPPDDLDATGDLGTQSPARGDRHDTAIVFGAPTQEVPVAQEPTHRAAREREFIDALGGGEPDDEQPPPESESEEDLHQRELIESVEEDPSRPYLYINGEFVPNPGYERTIVPDQMPSPPAAAMQPITPALNWSRIAGDSAYRVIRIPADPLRNGDRQMNITVHAGDVLRIVSGEIGIYYVMGQVNRVGPFAFNAERITLKAAVAAAGGLSGLAWPDRCTVYRRMGQREQMIQVNLDRIFAGKDPDFEIRRGDIINVGTHPFAPFLQRIREFTLPNPTSTVGYSFTYARNFADIDSFAVRRNPHNEPKRFPQLFP